MAAKTRYELLESAAALLVETADQLLQSKGGNFVYTVKPEMIEREIIEYSSRMRVSPMEIFNHSCYIALTNLYRSQADKTSHSAVGAVLMYVHAEYAEKLFKMMGYNLSSSMEEEEALAGITLDFFKEFIENYQKKLGSKYGAFILSEPQTFVSDVPGGVEFSYNEYSFYEISFSLWNKKVIAFNMTLAF